MSNDVKSPPPPSWRTLFVRFVLAVVAVFGGILLLLRTFVVPGEETNVRNYEKLLRSAMPTELFAHFPAAIPPNATGVRMSSEPKLLQGGGHFQLHVVLPAEDVNRIVAQRAPSALRRFTDGGDVNDHQNDPDADGRSPVPTTFFYTAPDGAAHVFPPSFTTYVLRVTPAPETKPGWNHGTSSGVSISVETGEVVYWADWW